TPVIVVTVGLGLDQRRTFAGAGALHRVPGLVVDLENILSVDDDAGDAVGSGGFGDVLHWAGVGVVRVLVVEIVLDHIDKRQFEQRRVVERTVKLGRGIGAVAAEIDHDLLAAACPDGEGRTSGDHWAGSNHAVGTHEADRLVGDVHFAGVAAVETGRPEIILRGHFLDIHALGDGVTGRAMGTVDQVDFFEGALVVQRSADARRDRFLSGIHMVVAAVVRLGEHLVDDGAVEPPDAQDGRIHINQFLVRQVLRPVADFTVGPGDFAADGYRRAGGGNTFQERAASLRWKRRACGSIGRGRSACHGRSPIKREFAISKSYADHANKF